MKINSDFLAATLEGSLLEVQERHDTSPEALEARLVVLERLCVETIKMINHLVAVADTTADTLVALSNRLERERR